jgi:methyl-accepting chemotaxis protein
MKNLKVWQKLAVMGVVFLILFAGITWRMITTINTLKVEFTQREIHGLDYCTPLLALVKDMQQHRGMANAFLNGDTSFKEGLAAKDNDLEKSLKRVDDVDRRLDAVLHTTVKWNEVKAECRDVVNRTLSLSAPDSFQRHTKAIENLMALVAEIDDGSNLALDPVIDSYYLSRVVISTAPELNELLAQARGLGSGLGAGKTATPEQLERLKRWSILIDYQRQKLDESMDKVFQANPGLKSQLDSFKQAGSSAMQEAAGLARKVAMAGTLETSSAEYFAIMTRHINAIFQLGDRAAESLSRELNQRADRYRREVWQTVGWAALGLVLVSSIGFFIMRDITRPLGQVVAMANQIATGQLDGRGAFAPRKDEIGVLAQAFDRMVGAWREMAVVADQIAAGDLAVSVKPQSDKDVMGNAFDKMVKSLRGMADVAGKVALGKLTVVISPQSDRDVMGNALATMTAKLSTLVGEVQRAGIQVNTSVTEIAATAKQQQATANEIAATTTEIGATSKEISATSKELVKTMNEVNVVAEETATLAGNGQAGLTRMEETMRQFTEASSSISSKLAVLNEKAGNINQVVTTIAKVADQTNLLSLNAAIEAEKAGEYGRGFAVVATEIRRLADQTAVATFDIEQMVKEMLSAVSAGVMGMDKFSEEVRRGVHEVQEVSHQLTQIIQQVQALMPRFESVTEGMQAQATGAQQISDALVQLSEAVQQTAESLRQSNSAIEQLNDASGGLRSGVSRFEVA